MKPKRNRSVCDTKNVSAARVENCEIIKAYEIINYRTSHTTLALLSACLPNEQRGLQELTLSNVLLRDALHFTSLKMFVCPSVSLSVTLQYYVEVIKSIVEILSPVDYSTSYLRKQDT